MLDEDRVPNVVEAWVERLLPHGGREAGGPRRLEVHVLWGDVLLTSRRFARDGAVTVGGARGLLWRLGGVPVGWVPAAAAPWLRASPPGLSTVTDEAVVDVDVGDALGEDAAEPLVSVVDGTQVVEVRSGWPCAAWRGDRAVDVDALLDEGAAERVGDVVRIPVAPDLRLAVVVGGLTLLLGEVEAGVRAPWSAAAPDLTLRGSILGVLVAALVLGTAAWRAPLPSSTTRVVPTREPFVELRLTPPPSVPRVRPTEVVRDGTGPRHADTTARTTRAPGAGPGRSGARSVSSWSEGFDGALASATDRLASGISGLIGPHVTSIGGGGLGGRGHGLGGPGSVEGLGGFPGGDGGERGRPHGGGDGKPCCAPMLPTGEEVFAMGEMDRGLIDEVIRRHLRSIRYCYQRRLQVEPELAGKLVVRFTIARDGTVSSVSRKDGSLDDAAVTDCVVERFRTMSFPEPPGGGVVVVTYPFTFAPA